MDSLRKKHEALMVQLSEAEDKVRELNRMEALGYDIELHYVKREE